MASINDSTSPSSSFVSQPGDESQNKAVHPTAINNTHTKLSPSSNDRSANNDENLRRQVGQIVADTQQTIDSHLTLFRVGLMVMVAASVGACVKLSGLLNRVNKVEDIPLWQFARRKKLRVRLIRQSRQDPSIFYVYHTPFFRRVVLQDVLPQSLAVSVSGKKESDLLAVRLFGVQVDETSEEWVWFNFVSSHRYLTIQLLQRISVEGSERVATCNIALRRWPLGKDFAHELVSHGYAECIPENLENYDNGSESGISYLAQRLKKLETAQKHAQVMQYGVWKDWHEEKLSDRVLSAGKRATTKGLKKIIDTFRQ
ncbi:hypothetical protein GN244_ATG03376 [Phytophthora infestans]|uniref:TNase-like domain-containing protein n=1 Tax=Phytophthora infestans TaxID=4787 RepID=A0A833WKZ1_PHYIN|nr:hypothetical protein GN244_ATG03376 [Phytophthora infestans]KAF4127701.1 hypothetical protein GN958_ATG23067 [Phytophthora infestans]KAI9992707.1 hypothetical protein PInf_014574 [Phytophthora infestans]